mgnify:CR=1 FL=1
MAQKVIFLTSGSAWSVPDDFNPSNNSEVDSIKLMVAELIDRVEAIKELDPRLAAVAQTSLEEACMWAVKLATTQK